MAVRRTEDDVLARTEAEREVGEILIEEGIVGPEDWEAPVLGRRVLSVLAKAVQFERATSRDPDRNAVANRRLVITGAWQVDPDGLASK